MNRSPEESNRTKIAREFCWFALWTPVVLVSAAILIWCGCTLWTKVPAFITAEQLHQNGATYFVDMTLIRIAHVQFTRPEAPATDIELERLKELPDLTSLALREAKISDVGIDHLSRLHDLRYLVVNTQAASIDKLRRLATELPGCQIILWNSATNAESEFSRGDG